LNQIEKTINVTKTARYYTNSASDKINSVVMAIHGYAQLAKDFIESFGFLDSESKLIIAPEGLSRFYFREKTGASWMTKEDRLNEINDYIHYLNLLMKKIENEYDLINAKKSLLGFSQGVHTAVRFFTASDVYFENLILCSSDFPKDADFEKLKIKSESTKIFYVYGNKDEIIRHGLFEAGNKLLDDNKIEFEKIIFSGGHKIDTEAISRILNK